MADRMYQFGFIGMGNMGYAILKGLLGVYSPEKITFSARNQEKIQDIAARTDVKPSENNRACASSCKYLDCDFHCAWDYDGKSPQEIWKALPDCSGYAQYSCAGR